MNFVVQFLFLFMFHFTSSNEKACSFYFLFVKALNHFFLFLHKSSLKMQIIVNVSLGNAFICSLSPHTSLISIEHNSIINFMLLTVDYSTHIIENNYSILRATAQLNSPLVA